MGTWALDTEAAPAGTVGLEIKVGGLRGGHSGLEIDKGRGNAIKVLNRVLLKLAPLGARLARIEGGNKRNAIAREASAVLFADPRDEAGIRADVARLVEMGMDVHRSTGVTRTVLGAVGQGHPDKALIELLDGVHEVVRISEPYKLASKTFKPEGTIVTVGDVTS